MIGRSHANLAALATWVAATDWVGFLAESEASRSNTSVCLSIVDPWFAALGEAEQVATAKRIASVLDERGAAFDIGGYRDAPPGLRIWAGATVETSDIEALTPWLDWAFAEVRGAAA